MTPARLRPEMRIPWWVAVAIYVASYVAWAGIRGWDFRPTPFWLLTALVLGALIATRSWLVKDAPNVPEDGSAPGKDENPHP